MIRVQLVLAQLVILFHAATGTAPSKVSAGFAGAIIVLAVLDLERGMKR